ncbi:MAG: hypothetical protein GW938_01060 [Leptospira sp.]|jgi:hypothetical protein|nr:hypothetical protein [Leptospira sp.]NCS92577.1 hypothetical protein [Leptospira sp.]
MSRIISLLILLFILPNLLFAGTTVSLRERKKTLESRMKILKDIDSAMNGWNLENYDQRIQEIQMQSDSAYREKSGTEQAKLMNYLEGDLHLLQVTYSDKMEESAQSLLEALAKEIVMHRDSVTTDINKREKTQKYFEMAKKEIELGRKYQRMNNPTLALHSFKRSLIYSFHTFYEYNYSLPNDYVGTYQYWIKKDLPNSPMMKDGLADKDSKEKKSGLQSSNSLSTTHEILKD